MFFSRMDIIKDFIDYLTTEFNKEVYKALRKESSYSPKKILDCWEWTEKDSYKTCNGSYSDILDDCLLDEIIEDWNDKFNYDEMYDIHHGAEQIAFVFDDKVYKISSHNTGNDVKFLIDDLSDKFKPLILPCTYEDFYKGCYIYTQDKVILKEYGYFIDIAKEKGIDYHVYNNGYIRSEDCCAAITMEYGVDFLAEFCDELADCGYPMDIHSENFGVTKDGSIKIFDPIYYDEY